MYCESDHVMTKEMKQREGSVLGMKMERWGDDSVEEEHEIRSGSDSRGRGRSVRHGGEIQREPGGIISTRTEEGYCANARRTKRQEQMYR